MVLMNSIEIHDLRRVDLNLLVAFEALMQTRSVTRMAYRLRIGQPAASHALKRLRDLLGDPLFVRTPAGMAPTPRAVALAEPIRSILTSIEATLFAGPAFDPMHARRIFRIGATDYAQSVIAAPLLARLRALAPECRLILTPTDCSSIGKALERGDIDLGFGAFPEFVSATHQQVLYRETYRCVLDPQACDVSGAIAFEQWLALPHVIMSTRGDTHGPIDDVLRARGERRDVVASTPNFLAIPFLLRGQRLVAALPTRVAELCDGTSGLHSCPMPFDTPLFDVSMVWNARTAVEPGAVWLREQIEAQCAELGMPA